MEPRLKQKYDNEVVGKLKQQFNFKNRVQVPSVEAIVLNVCTGDAIANSKILDKTLDELGAITGQKGVITRAHKSIATFKLREGLAIGAKVTLRRQRMWEFLDRFISVALPRVRDFRGINPRSFDGRGNYSIGFQEQIIFPEIEFDKIEKIRGLSITIKTSAKKDEHALALLEALGMPFFKKK